VSGWSEKLKQPLKPEANLDSTPGVIFLGSSHFGTRHWRGRVNYRFALASRRRKLSLAACTCRTLLQRRLKSCCLATADGEVVQVD